MWLSLDRPEITYPIQFSLELIEIIFLLLRHNFSDFVKPASSKGKSIDDIHLTEDELGLYLDLAPFVNPSPYIVPEDMSLAKVNHALLFDYINYALLLDHTSISLS